ncbi:MAG: ABC transporter permease [Gemmataceae bacterium]|nr:ABC transporter permease [Gemmataceae bacterium]
MGPFFYPIISISVLAFMGLLLWAAQRERPVADPVAGTVRIRHSMVFRWFSYFMAFVPPLGITVLLFFNPPRKDGDVFAIVFLYLLFGGLSAPLLWESLCFSVVLSSEGLDCRSPWRGRRFIPWNEVQELSYGAVNSWFIIRTRAGDRFRVSILVPGLKLLLEQFEQRLPSKAMEGARLGYTRIGRPFPERNRGEMEQEYWDRGPDCGRQP